MSPISQRLLELYVESLDPQAEGVFADVTYDMLRKRFRRYRVAAGISGNVGGPHVLRHTFASMCAESTDILWLQKYLGHHSLSSTQKYVHLDKSKSLEKMKRLWPLMD